MMGNVASKYDVRFVADVDGEVSEMKFTALDPEDVKGLVSALAAYYSGDPCRCFINGQEAVLENDWGLAELSPNSASDQNEPSICPNCDTPVPPGCGGLFVEDGSVCIMSSDKCTEEK